MINEKSILGNRLSDNVCCRRGEAISSFVGKRNQSFSISEEQFSKHLLLIGAIGTGKSTVMMQLLNGIIKNMKNNDIMLIFDSKGDYIRNFFRRDTGIIIGNGMSMRDYSYHWNLFDEVLADGNEPKNYEINVREMAATFFEGRGSQSQPFFANAAKDLFATLIIIFIRESFDCSNSFPYRRNNEDLMKFFQDLFENYSRLISILDKYNDTRRMITYLGKDKSEQSLGVIAELNTLLTDIFIGVFASSGNEFSMRNFVKRRGRKIIFLEYDLSVGNTLIPVYRQLVDLALKEVLGRNAGNGNFWLIADEFKLLPKLKYIDDALNFGRSLGVKVVAGLQNVSQLSDGYGVDRAASLISGFSSLISFFVNDVASREYITGYYGKNIVSYEYYDSKGECVVREREGNSVEDWDIMSLKFTPGEAIVGITGLKPFRFSFLNTI